MRILVTGGNQGIGFALCKQLVLEHNCHVFLTARSEKKGLDAISKINAAFDKTPGCEGSIDFVQLDTASDSSVASAAKAVESKLMSGEESGLLDAIVNNAGIGLQTKTGDPKDVVNTNLYGPKRVCEHFIPLMVTTNKGKTAGRIVNLGSGSGPNYVSGCSKKDQKLLCGPDTITWADIEKHKNENNNRSTDTYGLSKALLACYTGLLAREQPNLLVSCVTPGFINTQMTAGWGASKNPEQGTLAIKKCLFEDLDGSGYYYGSDGIRSQYHFMRNPGEPAYDGVNPFL